VTPGEAFPRPLLLRYVLLRGAYGIPRAASSALSCGQGALSSFERPKWLLRV
jgi:hypothetical protein